MELTLGSLGKIQALNYLTVENCDRYRAICAFAYHQFTNFSNQFSKEEVLFFLKSDDRFDDYTETMLDSDLNKLIEWNNLVAIQDKTDVKTISEFKLKRFRYQCSEETIAIERNLHEFFEKKKISTATLEKNMVEMLVAELEKINSINIHHSDNTSKEFLEVVYRHWKELELRSKALRDNTQDFFNHVNSDAFESMTNRESFIPFKERFLSYLEEFVNEIGKHSYKIRSLIMEIDEKMDEIVGFVYDYLMSVPLMDNEIDKTALMNQWLRLKNWFVSNGKFTSNFELLEILTRDTIERVCRVAGNLQANLFNNRDRSSDYKKIAMLFHQCASDKEAKELGAYVFGFESCKAFGFPKHLTTTESENLPEIGEQVHPFEVSTITARRRGENKSRTRTIDKEAQELKKEQKRLQMAQEREDFLAIIHNDEIVLKDAILTPNNLKIVLTLVSSLLNTRKQTKRDNIAISSDYGNVSLELLSDEQILIRATHGTMSFKDYKLKFGV